MHAATIGITLVLLTALFVVPAAETREGAVCVAGAGVGACNEPALVYVCISEHQCVAAGHQGCGGAVCPPPHDP